MSFGFSGFGGGKCATSGDNNNAPTPLSSLLNSESITTAATSKAAKQLNDKITDLNQKMKHYGLNVKTDFGAIGGGLVDDSDAFEAMLNFINQNSGKYTIEIPQDKYKITRRLRNVTRSNVIINMNFSTIIWDGVGNTGNSAIDRSNAIFNFSGSLSSTTIPVTSVNLDRNPLDVNTQNYHSGEIVLVGAHDFVAGDYIYLNASTGSFSTSRLTPREEKILLINQVVDNTLYVDYWTPYSYRGETLTTATVRKCTPIKGISIKNVILHDTLDIAGDVSSTITQSPNLNRYVSGFTFKDCVDVNLENITGINTKLPVIFAQRCKDIRFKKGFLDKPYIIGPGEGYLIQVLDSTHVQVSHLSGQVGRHLTDFTGSAFCTVEDCNGFFMRGIGFQQHGKYEHNISYIRCVGKFHGASGQAYGNAGKYITFKECNIFITGGSDPALQKVAVENSDVRLAAPIPEATFRNCNIKMFTSGTPSLRIPDVERKLIFNNCDVMFYDTKTDGAIMNYGELSFNGGSLSTYNKTALFSVKLGTINNVKINNVEINNVSFEIQSSGQDVLFEYINNDVVGQHHWNGFINTRFINNCVLTLRVNGNKVKNNPTSADQTKPRMFRVPMDNHSNVTIYSQFIGNILTNVSAELNQMSIESGSKGDYSIIKDNTIINGALTSNVENKIMEDNHIVTIPSS